MIHLLFLIAGLGLVMLGQQLTLLALKRIEGGIKRWIELLALAMPVSLLVLFSLTMLPDHAAGHPLTRRRPRD
ncbi:MAG: hypothetical protein J0I20_32700 [Chloroflexi bacterium]|nr:hypothetical protein [Chloroflexota bacterium]OJV91754.1 MAG: hypothetical protein BGO39_17825 [Chloroflexi bacterium 54-19]